MFFMEKLGMWNKCTGLTNILEEFKNISEKIKDESMKDLPETRTRKVMEEILRNRYSRTSFSCND